MNRSVKFFLHSPISQVAYLNMASIAGEMLLERRNNNPEITNAMSMVDAYIPVPDFSSASTSKLSTTIISAFFPPPDNEPLVRRMGGDPFVRDPKEYIEGLKLLSATSCNLVLFLPPGEY